MALHSIEKIKEYKVKVSCNGHHELVVKAINKEEADKIVLAIIDEDAYAGDIGEDDRIEKIWFSEDWTIEDIQEYKSKEPEEQS